MFHTSVFRLFVGAAVAFALMAPASAAVDCDAKPDHPQCRPGNEAQPVTPARITFANGVGNDIEGDSIQGDGVYEGLDSPDGLEVFIGSAANSGNIFLQNDTNLSRTLRINMPENGCGLPVGFSNFPFRRLRAQADAVFQDGVLGMSEGDLSGGIPMRILFEYSDDRYWLNFKPTETGPCKNQSGYAQVERLADDPDGTGNWTVTNDSNDGTACIEKVQKRPAKSLLCAGLVEMDFSFHLDEELPQ